MGTPCVVALKEADKVTYVSINYDGYVTGVGAMLIEHYSTVDRVREMIAGGNISVLKANCDGGELVDVPHYAKDGSLVGTSKERKHSFENPQPDQTIYYGRDRGESGTDPQITDLFGFYRATKSITAYVYENGQWFLVTEPYRKPGEYVAFMDRWVLSDLAPIVTERMDALQRRIEAERQEAKRLQNRN